MYPGLLRPLWSAIDRSKELMGEIRELSTCNVKQVTAAILVPYQGSEVPTVMIGNTSYGIFVGTNRNDSHNCKEKGRFYCTADRLNPDRPNGNIYSEIRRLQCVMKQCGEAQAGQHVLQVVEQPSNGILISSEVPCPRCVDWLIKHPFVRYLFFDKMNENKVGESPFKATSAYELSDLHILAGIESFWLDQQGDELEVIPGTYFELPGWTGEYINRPYFPENGPEPERETEKLLEDLARALIHTYARQVHQLVYPEPPEDLPADWHCETCNSRGEIVYSSWTPARYIHDIFVESHSKIAPSCTDPKLIMHHPNGAPDLKIDGIGA